MAASDFFTHHPGVLIYFTPRADQNSTSGPIRKISPVRSMLSKIPAYCLKQGRGPTELFALSVLLQTLAFHCTTRLGHRRLPLTRLHRTVHLRLGRDFLLAPQFIEDLPCLRSRSYLAPSSHPDENRCELYRWGESLAGPQSPRTYPRWAQFRPQVSDRNVVIKNIVLTPDENGARGRT
jgi:hypothetical protein